MNAVLKSRFSQWPVAGRRLLSAIPLLLISCLGFAAGLEESGAAQPAQTVPLVYVVLFLILFFGLIVGFFAYLAYTWRRDEESKKQGKS